MLPGLAALVAVCGGGSSTPAPGGAAGAPAGRQIDPADELLVWHEIVNDITGGRPVAVTYCPLCNSASARAP
jgi:hypothetical protein